MSEDGRSQCLSWVSGKGRCTGLPRHEGPHDVVIAPEDLVRRHDIRAMEQTLLIGRRTWLDRQDAQEMAIDLFEAGFRKVEVDG